jgi:group I intron endonuclease
MYIPDGTNINCGIYRIVNRTNGKSYIGSTKNAERRKQEHFYDLKKNKHHCDYLQNAWNAAADKSVFEFHMFIFCKEADLIAYEQSCFNTMKPEYNSSSLAGRTGHSPLTCKKISQSLVVHHAGKTPEARKEIVQKGLACQTKEQLSENGKKGNLARTTEERSSSACEWQAARTSDDRSASAAKGWSNQTKEQRVARVKKRVESTPVEIRVAVAKIGNAAMRATMTPEKYSLRAKKSAETRKRKKLEAAQRGSTHTG